MWTVLLIDKFTSGWNGPRKMLRVLVPKPVAPGSLLFATSLNAPTASFGNITTTVIPARLLQLGLKYTF
jgi:hypothetical protein